MKMLDVPAVTTIKERLLLDIQSGEQSPDALGKRYGLNGHDLVKNLEQLRKEGFIHVQWGAGNRIQRVRANPGATNMKLLAASPPPAHQATDSTAVVAVANAINKLPWRNESWREWDTELMRKASGLTIFQITRAVGMLREQGRLQQLGGGGRGKRIEGVRWRGERAPDGFRADAPAESVADAPKAASEPSQAVRDTIAYLKAHGHGDPELPLTPMLTRYMEAKRIAALVPADNPYITTTFEPDLLAEEAIKLLEQLKAVYSPRDRAQGTESRD